MYIYTGEKGKELIRRGKEVLYYFRCAKCGRKELDLVCMYACTVHVYVCMYMYMYITYVDHHSLLFSPLFFLFFFVF